MLIGCLADVNVGNQYKFVKNIGDTGGKWYICNAFLCNTYMRRRSLDTGICRLWAFQKRDLFS